MLEFIVVPHPSFMPMACACCGSAAGPVVDTHRELPVYGRVYVCELCVTRAARVLGLVKGKRMNELQAAAKRLSHAEEQAAQLLVERDDLNLVVQARDEHIERLKAELEEERGKLEGLREHLKGEAERALTAVSE